jgi:hypothetical protein
MDALLTSSLPAQGGQSGPWQLNGAESMPSLEWA